MSIVFVYDDEKYISYSELWLKKKERKKTTALEGLGIFPLVLERAVPSPHRRKLTYKQKDRRERRSRQENNSSQKKELVLVNKSFKASVLRETLSCRVNYFVLSTLLFSHISRFLQETALCILNSSAFWMLQHETKNCVCFFFNFLLWKKFKHVQK